MSLNEKHGLLNKSDIQVREVCSEERFMVPNDRGRILTIQAVSS